MPDRKVILEKYEATRLLFDFFESLHQAVGAATLIVQILLQLTDAALGEREKQCHAIKLIFFCGKFIIRLCSEDESQMDKLVLNSYTTSSGDH